MDDSHFVKVFECIGERGEYFPELLFWEWFLFLSPLSDYLG